MNLRYFDTRPISSLVREFFCLSFTEEDLPFTSKIVPVGFTSLTYIYGNSQIAQRGKTITNLQGLTLTGQFSSSYLMKVDDTGDSFGINFHPTGLFKLLGQDLSQFTNRHIKFSAENHPIAQKLEHLFQTHQSDWEGLVNALIQLIKESSITKDDKLEDIDRAIHLIEEKEGMVSVCDILSQFPFSQKTFETHFKKIVGVTPGKFIRLHRFTKLMRRYESQELSVKDLILMYDYYDRSHFAKDFKLYMNESPRQYFDKEYPLIREYLKNVQLR